ncbi:MAG: glycosyltransferase family 2 protein [Clostridiales bacterium]|nr:glycosyltransferase family 2 protein [Clostridiales bacterium]
MNQQADISIIVPCYNSDRYLSACLHSLKAQKGPSLEMIFIDDGSQDSTGALLDAFAAEDARAKVLHIPNGGVSAARNRGLDLATGRYIAFVDADDALEENAMQLLHAQAMRTGAQIVSAAHAILDMDRSERIPVETEPVSQEPQGIVREIIHMHRIYNNIWNKLYDRTLFEDVRLDENVRIGEDALLNLRLFLRAGKVAYLSDITYVYRIHGSSAMAGVRSHSDAHQPMLRSMSRILLAEGVKERYFRDFLQTCVWIDEKERGIRACMQTFHEKVRPLVLEGIEKGRIDRQDRMLYSVVSGGFFPAFYVLMRVREKLTGKRWGIRR